MDTTPSFFSGQFVSQKKILSEAIVNTFDEVIPQDLIQGHFKKLFEERRAASDADGTGAS